MPNQRQPSKPKSTEEILREIESTSYDTSPNLHEKDRTHAKSGGAIKSLLNFFVKIDPEEGEAAKPAQPATGARVSDLVADEPAPAFSAPLKRDASLSDKAFEDIYREAGIGDSPCSADDLAKLMDNPTVANQPLSVKVIAVNLTLSAKGISIDTPISDAVRRDRALEAYQKMLIEHASATEQRNTGKIQQITQETEEYLKRKQSEMEALRAEVAEAKRQSMDFSQRREVEETRLAGLVSPFLEGKPNPVTVGHQGSDGNPNQ
jgi:hypothetical protein